MNDQAPALLTVPTELERSDGLLDLIVLVAAALGVWELSNLGVPLWLPAPLVLPLAIWVLTGEAAGDVPYIGGLAVALRNAFGLRRAHEWVWAWWHFYWLTGWRPAWRQRCEALFESSRRRITRWHRRLSVRTRCSLSRAYFWGSAIRSSLSPRLGR
jgi:hypothetical protein